VRGGEGSDVRSVCFWQRWNPHEKMGKLKDTAKEQSRRVWKERRGRKREEAKERKENERCMINNSIHNTHQYNGHLGEVFIESGHN